MFIFFFAFFVIIVLGIMINIRAVPQSKAFVIERLGKYKCTWHAGLHVKIPFIDKVAKQISLKEQVLDFEPQPVITKDNVTIMIDSVCYAVVFDPELYTYGIENPRVGLQNLTASTLRSIIGDMELDATLTSREEINSKMLAILDEATDPWGIKIKKVTVKSITPPPEIQEVMQKQMRAERERRQTVLEAQAHQEAVVSRAEGDKRAKILAAEAERDAQIALAEGKAKSIKMVYDAEAEGIDRLNKVGITDPVLKLRSIEALKNVADGRATKIYMPSDIANVVTTLGVVGESLGIGDATPIDKTAKPKATLDLDPCISDGRNRRSRRACPDESML